MLPARTRKVVRMDILTVLITGAVLALIASAIRRGKSGMPWWGNWLAGIGGAVIGYWIAAQLGVAATNGIDWMRWIISVIVAIILLGLGGGFFHKRR